MNSKYKMTREQSIFYAKRNIVDYIWKDATLEGIAITYPDTMAIYNGMSISGYKVNEIIAVNNLKHAWGFILDNLDYPIDYNYICKINQIVGGDSLIYRAGYVRDNEVSIGGTNWKPSIPDEIDIKENLASINGINNVTERAITLMLYLMRIQMFFDGNKRTAMLAANQIMISCGEGVIAVPTDKQSKFLSLLVEFYQTNSMNEIKEFIYDNCIDGANFK